ncbi:uncharacterized protein BDR25DRAFT_349671 [Lindgomyces ingoldianus]|uniref:Uncharacterized protein n=1 Tax=Lindgomyces ingoldianus TaxID=673940 RepID=A0ACB6RDP6_9PLEO|nr:uncharacterized protein BDR25DRAFT_349671 [Lindgomyces ingoldianus]KAF2476601.1 hypothetical protein BDR25DRAFT_349671 [Lindgomyces ingoldianus]
MTLYPDNNHVPRYAQRAKELSTIVRSVTSKYGKVELMASLFYLPKAVSPKDIMWLRCIEISDINPIASEHSSQLQGNLVLEFGGNEVAIPEHSGSDDFPTSTSLEWVFNLETTFHKATQESESDGHQAHSSALQSRLAFDNPEPYMDLLAIYSPSTNLRKSGPTEVYQAPS